MLESVNEDESPCMRASIGISAVGNFLNDSNGKEFSDIHLVVFVLEIFSMRNKENISRTWFMIERGSAKAKIL